MPVKGIASIIMKQYYYAMPLAVTNLAPALFFFLLARGPARLSGKGRKGKEKAKRKKKGGREEIHTR